MQMKLGNPQTCEKLGGVSAMDFNSDVTRMLIGYNRGKVCEDFLITTFIMILFDRSTIRTIIFQERV